MGSVTQFSGAANTVLHGRFGKQTWQVVPRRLPKALEPIKHIHCHYAEVTTDPKIREDFERRFRKMLRRGWFRKPRYRYLSYIFPRWVMGSKIRKTYHRPVAKIAEGAFLDLGCGLGSCAALRGYLMGGFNVGVDFAFSAMNYAKNEARRMGIPSMFVAADGFRLPFIDGVFDSVYVGQVIEHLDDPLSFLAEAVRVLREDGILIVSVPKGEACGGEAAGHVNFYYTENDCIELLTNLPVRHTAFHPFHRHRFFFSCRRLHG